LSISRNQPARLPSRERGGTMELISLIAFLLLIAAWIVAPERGSLQA
jgi:hypothetical protein